MIHLTPHQAVMKCKSPRISELLAEMVEAASALLPQVLESGPAIWGVKVLVTELVVRPGYRNLLDMLANSLTRGHRPLLMEAALHPSLD